MISKAEEESEYLSESFLIASLTEFISEFVSSEIVFFETGLPFKYKTASIFVTNVWHVSLFLLGIIWSIIILKSKLT